MNATQGASDRRAALPHQANIFNPQQVVRRGDCESPDLRFPRITQEQ